MSEKSCSDEEKVDGNVKLRPFRRHVLCWIDLELTGLDHNKDTIVEIAVILTDVRLKRKLVGPNVVIHTTPEQLSPWCTETFQQNGLFEAMQVAESTVEEAEERVLAFLRAHVEGPGVANLAGSSVHVDRIFLIKHMPRIIDFLHYRIVDVSSLNICARAWCPNRMRNACTTTACEDVPKPEESEAEEEPPATAFEPNAHRAMWDLEQSITALRFLRDEIFKKDIGNEHEVKAKASHKPHPKPAKRPTKPKGSKARF